ncbi:MAG: fibronectin type III domain-containing protein [Candidatus Zixiibacteriota bacterium]|nr:MAG: fibronectin type III domain-containing protein [candidate division Zixibacteria bacterium]
MKIDLFNAPSLLKRLYLASVIVAIFLIGSHAFAQQELPLPADSLDIDTLAQINTPLPPINLAAEDTPDDGGGSITVTWDPSPDDFEGGNVRGYKIFRAEYNGGQPGEFVEVGDVPSGDSEYSNEDGNTTDGVQYVYKVGAVNRVDDEMGDARVYVSDSEQAGPVVSSAQWFHTRRINVLVAVLLLSLFIVYFIQQAKAGKELYIRRIAGMEAVDEAVGRATEMGKKIFYITGLGDMDNMQTIASMTILGRVAELAAEYETYLDVPVCRSLVMVTGREVVKEAYSKAGRPDSFKPDQVHYLTDDQFGYAAAVDGMFVREEPATIFYMGQFFAESLILAETGNSIGAIQIAGTAMPAQLPFFVAACDYTLIGEELFAASSYLSKEPKLLGSLKGQDIGKGVILAALILGVILESLGVWQLSNLFLVK